MAQSGHSVSGSLPAAHALNQATSMECLLVKGWAGGHIKHSSRGWSPGLLTPSCKEIIPSFVQWGTGSSKTPQMSHIQLLRDRMEVQTLLCLLPIPGLSPKHGSLLLRCSLLSGKPEARAALPATGTRTHTQHAGEALPQCLCPPLTVLPRLLV